MITVTATKLRSDIFVFLDKVAQGETITVQRNGREVALMVPANRGNWRDRMREKIKLLVPPDEAFAPLEDTWEEYI
ncbi:MAG: type II toxin-antitoxin system prevent-host-death family antitoxin [Candidatus Aminicenantes bacterium]|nr:type II toxin-antitoxin system prevent-host-death family antitoxin [Candidatus Aminicenantes bacterium]